MPGPKPYALTLSDRQQVVLHSLVCRQTSPQRLVYRAKVILAAAAGQSNEHIAQQLGLNRHTVRTWRRRWQSAVAAGAEAKVLRARIEAVLGEAPRPGTPETCSAEQLTQILWWPANRPKSQAGP